MNPKLFWDCMKSNIVVSLLVGPALAQSWQVIFPVRETEMLCSLDFDDTYLGAFWIRSYEIFKNVFFCLVINVHDYYYISPIFEHLKKLLTPPFVTNAALPCFDPCPEPDNNVGLDEEGSCQLSYCLLWQDSGGRHNHKYRLQTTKYLVNHRFHGLRLLDSGWF